MSPQRLPSIIVTGASGFIGRNFLAAARERFHVYAFSRQPPGDLGIPPHRNVEWVLVDIANEERLRAEIERIEKQGGAEFVLHLAAYYDYSYKDHPEYQRTNVEGTRILLEACRRLRIRRFVFASSVTVSTFPRPEGPITEASPPDADFPYARSKREGEELVREASKHFPCTVVRLAAVFSDWCEYGPLFMLLATWLSTKWNARILAGHGRSAIPYIHVHYVVAWLLRLFFLSHFLRPFDILLVSPDEATGHRQLFELATRLHFGSRRRPWLLPKPAAALGLALIEVAGWLLGRHPLERLWMLHYIDRQMETDSRYTRKTVPARLQPRYRMDRRLLFMIENAKSFPAEWHIRNTAAVRRSAERPNLLITDIMLSHKSELLAAIYAHLTAPRLRMRFRSYQRMDADKLRWYIDLIYKLIMTSVRTNDRMPVVCYARYLASVRKKEGFPFGEIRDALAATGELIIRRLLQEPALQGKEQLLNDRVRLTFQLAIDEVEDAYELIAPSDAEPITGENSIHPRGGPTAPGPGDEDTVAAEAPGKGAKVGGKAGGGMARMRESTPTG